MTPLSSADPAAVLACYDLLDLSVTGGIEDFTEGIYAGDPKRPYPEAQRLKNEYLLDEIGCRRGSRILDIGCGYGTLLEAAHRRGAAAVGITISQPQLARCRAKGLDVRLMNYRCIPRKWNGRFDGIVASGSIEHFVQAREAAAGLQDRVYREFFEICHRLLTPSPERRRVVTTVVHYNRVADPVKLTGCPFFHRWGSDDFHYSMLIKSFGGYYPAKGQLERCAAGLFTCVHAIDGTRDYHLTSEHWLAALKTALMPSRGLWPRLLRKMTRRPAHTLTMLGCLLLSQSWCWQFRTATPPTTLLRHTWRRVGVRPPAAPEFERPVLTAAKTEVP